MATDRQVFIANVFFANDSVVLFSCLIINCPSHLSLAWSQVEKCQPRSNLTRPNGGSKFQVLLHDFPSLRQPSQETSTFIVRSRNKRQFLKIIGQLLEQSMRQKQRHFVGECCSLLRCFRDFLIKQHVWPSFFFLRRHVCNRHTWLTRAKENWRQIWILQLDFAKFPKDKNNLAKFL